ncbi:MAG: response regulator [Micavibrio sp.]|nr:response regulator [Micavibrio sp.]|tara:strand:- start:64 stop:1014 length:951 start_codon:yes stop_codon:yes gene_type:complete
MSSDFNVDYSLLEKEKPMNILAVEDDQMAMSFLEIQIKELGHNIITANDGQQALVQLEKHPGQIDVVLMDRFMPVMDGLSAVKRMKDNHAWRNIPVIMVTGADSMDEMKEGLDAGVFYYLTKPVNDDMLRSVLSAAVREAQQIQTLAEELGKHKTSFNLIETARFNVRTLDEARSLSAFIANCFPEPERVLSGLGELLINAIEHGNIGIGYDRKTDLVANNTWESEINRLQTLPENEHKFVTATVAHKVDGTYVVIEDQGEGFAWKNFLQIDPARAGDNHGRGIAQANTISFDKLTYNDKGNQAIAFVGLEKQLEW